MASAAGVKLPEQERMCADRRGSGTTFFRHAELNKLGIPVLAAIYGDKLSRRRLSGYFSELFFSTQDCNIAVGGAGIVSGMSQGL